jgi:hypothetical protein
MGFTKEQRATIGRPAQALGSTGGTIQATPPVSVLTSTATGVVYTLPTPQSGLQKTLVLDYTGATGSVTIANASTATVFNGTTANVITVSSSETTLVLNLVGVSQSKWAVGSSTGSGVTLAASTVVS